jgi:hypothetical protein
MNCMLPVAVCARCSGMGCAADVGGMSSGYISCLLALLSLCTGDQLAFLMSCWPSTMLCADHLLLLRWPCSAQCRLTKVMSLSGASCCSCTSITATLGWQIRQLQHWQSARGQCSSTSPALRPIAAQDCEGAIDA